MIIRTSSHYGDDTCSSYVTAGDFIFLSHHAGGHESNDIVHQMEASFDSLAATLESAGATFGDIVQINLYLKNIEDFRVAKDVFYKYFKKDHFPARMTTTTDFVNPTCLCMLDAVAYSS
ncbi:RidA family protein [Paenibacillus sabinae]|uniref:Putative translation initiation inhibitor, yjgF family protein n=1 Tax=Paenibacillus sabinae T27 TaxID=1268072 RepID=X4ZHG4_9BACL|nr:RidA family protein [Paenibacillus sabinae]AHV96807.1 putative translation initiation inhibitor, yjgF family protein [Paenibacillus sabinae T27]